MDRTEKIELTMLCMVYKDNKILLQNRVKDSWCGYTFPGGHIEAGESFVEAAIREVKEETGLTIYNPILCGIKQFPINNGRYVVLLFKTDKFEGDLVSSDEGKMEWVNRDELKNKTCVDDFMELLRVFDEDSLSEFQYIVEDNKWNVHLR